MGINFPCVCYVVQYGPPTSVVDLMQQGGRAGRDASQAHCVACLTKQQLARCGKEVKHELKSVQCQRQVMYSHFSDSVEPLFPGHLCCSICRLQCTCGPGGETFEGTMEVFVAEADDHEMQTEPENETTRTLTPEDENDLRMALLELKTGFSGSVDIFLEPTASHGFTEQLMEDIGKLQPGYFHLSFCDRTSQFIQRITQWIF